MALDTQEKRMAAVGVARPWMRGKLPGTNDVEWRAASGNGYGAYLVSVVPTVPPPTEFKRATDDVADNDIYQRREPVVDAV